MTDQSISQSEFQRFQDQLISLKEGKYKSEERCEILCRNLKHLEIKCGNLERELMKANEFKSKIRCGKDLEMLLDDNQVLRDRMSATEANFKLQNDILRTECERLLSENERLKCQIETTKDPNISDENIRVVRCEDDKDKVRSLQFEVTKLMDEKRKSESENYELKKFMEDSRKVEKELVIRVDSLLNEKSKLGIENERLKELLNIERLSYEKNMNEIKKKHEEEISRLNMENNDLIDQSHKMKEEQDEALKSMLVTYEQKSILDRQVIENDCKTKLDILNEERKKYEREYNAQIEECRLEILSTVEEWKTKLDERDQTHQLALHSLEEKHSLIVTNLELEISKLQESLQYAEEELKLYDKKNQRLLKDVKKQLEKEMKLSQDVQTKLEVQSSGSQNSQAKVHEYLGGSSQMYSTDDQSSLHSSSNNGVLSDGGQWPSPSIAVTDDELRTLLDRLTNVQNDYCEFKRKIETLKQEKNQLIETIKRQENIILNYIKNRGGSDSCDTSPDNTRKKHSTAEALTLNGLMSSPVHSKTSLSSLLTKVKDTLQSFTPQDILPLSGDKFSYRVTDVDVKQLQRVCEELMMRCLNLETDLQTAVDLNVKLSSKTPQLGL